MLPILYIIYRTRGLEFFASFVPPASNVNMAKMFCQTQPDSSRCNNIRLAPWCIRHQWARFITQYQRQQMKQSVTYSRQVNPAMQRLAPLLPGFFEPPQLFGSSEFPMGKSQTMVKNVVQESFFMEIFK